MSEAILVVVKETKHIPLDDIVIGTGQFRTRNLHKGIEELALNIKTVGLINAITVCELENGKYDLIAGQRRVEAHELLGEKTIRANVLNRRLTEEEKRRVSLSENITIVRPSRADYLDACTALYRKYQSITEVSRILGLKQATVSEYVHYDQLICPLKALVDKDIIPVKIAKRAQNAAINEFGEIDEEAALVYAKEMRTMTDEGTKRMVKIAQQNPKAPLAENVEKGRKQGNIRKIRVTISGETNDSLEKFAKDEGTNAEGAASTLIDEGLEDKGYLQRET